MTTVVSRIELGRELAQTLTSINKQIKVVEDKAEIMGFDAHDIRDANGNWALIPLLAAKAQILHALVLINKK